MTKHPAYLRTTEQWAQTMWGHLPPREFQANLEYMLKNGNGLSDQGCWWYPEFNVTFVKDGSPTEGDPSIWWYVHPDPRRLDCAVLYDNHSHFVIVLTNQMQAVSRGGVVLETIKGVTTSKGVRDVLCSKEVLLAGHHPACWIHAWSDGQNIHNEEK